MDELIPKEQSSSPFSFTPRDNPNPKPLTSIGIGDMAGVPFEFVKFNLFRKPDKLFDEADLKKEGQNPYFISDDTLCAAYLAHGLMDAWDATPEDRSKILVQKLKECVQEHDGSILGSFGTDFNNWGYTKGTSPLRPGSMGDGAPMRAGFIGSLCSSIEECDRLCEELCDPSHNHPESLKATKALNNAIYLARAGVDMKDIHAFIATKFNYDPIPTLEDCKTRNQELLAKKLAEEKKKSGKYIDQDEICPLVMPLVFSCLFNSNSYEEAMQNVMYIGGDCDTIGDMVSALSAPYYGIPPKYVEEYEKRLKNPPDCERSVLAVNKEASLQAEKRVIDTETNPKTGKPQYKRVKKNLKADFQKQAEIIQQAELKLENFIQKNNPQPDMDEVLREIADARVKYHMIQQSREKTAPAPKKDEKLRELLAEKEAVRLYYAQDKENLAKTPEERTAQLERLKSGVLAAPEFQKKCGEMKSWPMKTVTEKNYKITKKSFDKKLQKNVYTNPDIKVKRLDADKIPQKMLDDSILPSLLTAGTQPKAASNAGQEVKPKVEAVKPKVEAAKTKAPAAAKKQPEAPDVPVDINIITASPAFIYKGIQLAVMELKTGSRMGSLFSEKFPGLPEFMDEYRTKYKNKIDVDEVISIDLNHIGDGTTIQPIMERLGFTPDQLSEINATVNNQETFQRVMEELRLYSRKPEESIQNAQEKLNRGEFVDLTRIAQIGADAGQAIATNMVNTSLEQEDAIAPEDGMDAILDALKKTEGMIFRYSTQSYNDVRDALTDVVKLHKKIAKYIDAPEGSVERAKFTKTSEDLQKAYQKLDKAADTYLKGKSERMIERMKDNNPDPRGNKRYNIIASLRTVTGPTMQKKMAESLKELGQKITLPDKAEKQIAKDPTLERKSQASVKNV